MRDSTIALRIHDAKGMAMKLVLRWWSLLYGASLSESKDLRGDNYLVLTTRHRPRYDAFGTGQLRNATSTRARV